MQAINFLTHLILDLLRWTSLAGRPQPSHLVRMEGVEPPAQGFVNPRSIH